MLSHITDHFDGIFDVIGLDENFIEKIDTYLLSYLLLFVPCFNEEEHLNNARLYMMGLLSDLPRKTCLAIALKFAKETDVRNLEHFLRGANWSHEDMIIIHHLNVLKDISREGKWMLTLDGSDMPKKGKNSPGVSRQYCGARGKVDNCISFVFIGYTTKYSHGLFNGRMYLPEEWLSEDFAEQRAKCGIPLDIQFKTKNQLAREQIQKVIDLGGRPDWILGDGAFGHDTELLDSLPEWTNYFMNVHKDDTFFIKMPELELPPYSGRGRKPSVLKPNEAPVRIENIIMNSEITWNTATFGIGSDGVIEGMDKLIRVVDVRNGLPNNYVWIYARKLSNGEKRYFISDAPEDTTIDKFRELATMRWPIEQCFQECKSLLGLDHYLGRSWDGFHRHMAFVIILHFFLQMINKSLSVPYVQLSEFGQELYRIIFEGSDEYNPKDEDSNGYNSKDESSDKYNTKNEGSDECNLKDEDSSGNNSKDESSDEYNTKDEGSDEYNLKNEDSSGYNSKGESSDEYNTKDEGSDEYNPKDEGNTNENRDVDSFSINHSNSVVGSKNRNRYIFEKKRLIKAPIITLSNVCLLFQSCFEHTYQKYKRALMIIGALVKLYHQKLKNSIKKWKEKKREAKLAKVALC
jgi:SRSO17 transposase